MANHISNAITISNVNGEVREELSRIFKLNEELYNEVYTTHLISTIFDKPEYTDEDYDREWVLDNCGAKWFNAYVTDDSDDTIFINITSAWDPINPLLEVLTKKLVNINKEVIVESIFEDEGCNFAGVFYGSNEYINEEYIDIEDWDINRFFSGEEEDEGYRDEFLDVLNNMVEIERGYHYSEKTESNT